MNLSDENFEKEINVGEKPILVDFWAEWCGPCNALGPILEKIAEDYKEKVIVAKVNVDSAPLSSQKYQVSQIPKVILFKGGKPVSGFIGARPEQEIKEWLDKNI